MNPNEINKLKEKAPWPLFMLLMLFFLPAFLLEPEVAALNSSSKSFDASLKKARADVVSRANLEMKQARLNSLEKIHQAMQVDIPEESSLPALIDSLQNIAAANAVSLESVTYTLQKEYEKLAVPGYQIIMNLSAGYPDMRKFLAAVESLKTPIIVNEIVLSENNRYVLTMRLLVK